MMGAGLTAAAMWAYWGMGRVEGGAYLARGFWMACVSVTVAAFSAMAVQVGGGTVGGSGSEVGFAGACTMGMDRVVAAGGGWEVHRAWG
jgi:hypothetical protein